MSAVTRVVVTADTHLRRTWPNRRLPEAAIAVLRTADRVLHAGDITQAEHLELEIAGVRVGMIHDSGPARDRERRLHARFADADVVVFGHSHIPWNATGVDGQHGDVERDPEHPHDARRLGLGDRPAS